MYAIFHTLVVIFWILDIFNFPFMEIFNTVYPLNGWFWLIVLLCLPTIENVYGKRKKRLEVIK